MSETRELHIYTAMPEDYAPGLGIISVEATSFHEAAELLGAKLVEEPDRTRTAEIQFDLQADFEPVPDISGAHTKIIGDQDNIYTEVYIDKDGYPTWYLHQGPVVRKAI